MINLHIQASSGHELLHHLAHILDLSKPEVSTPGIVLPAQFGAPLQGGFYAGPHWKDGKLVHLIGANESLGDHQQAVAKEKASALMSMGHDDWFLPTKDQLTVGLLYAKDKFDKVWHWTSTPYGSLHAWAVDFEDGHVNGWDRSGEFRVRPFRIYEEP